MSAGIDLSVIIVSWNTVGMLRDCLNSVWQGLNETSGEVIVVDNGSNDGSPEMVKQEFKRTILITNMDNRGFAAANNQALEIARGEFILLLNSDTVVHGDVLKCSVEYMRTNSQVGAMGCRVLNTDGTLQPTCSRYPSLPNLLLLTSGLWKLSWPPVFDRYQMRRWDRTDERDVEVVSGCYMLVRASALNQVGLLDESFFFFGEETDWSCRFRAQGWKLRFAPVGEITHHGGGSVRRLNSRRDLMLSSAMVQLHLKHGGVLAGLMAWLIVLAFNLSRAVYWLAASALRDSDGIRVRRDHFVSLVCNHGRVWPRRGTYRFEP